MDFDLINGGQDRLSLGAVNVCMGTSTYFDTKNTLIHSDHVRASGALPPGFPPVMIDGKLLGRRRGYQYANHLCGRTKNH